ncbi:MAG TPA: C-GCAxxG-C-C family protein, partial [Candidatus Limnocylindrales bacterium]
GVSRIHGPGMTSEEARSRARALFLDDERRFGCAETTFIVLKEAFGLPDTGAAGPAMALNGGVAWSGGLCGAISGAALAVGSLAEHRHSDRSAAKTIARTTVARLMADFERTHGSIDCRALIGCAIASPDEHAAFISGGRWRVVCMSQIEWVVGRLAEPSGDVEFAATGDAAPLADPSG